MCGFVVSAVYLSFLRLLFNVKCVTLADPDLEMGGGLKKIFLTSSGLSLV